MHARVLNRPPFPGTSHAGLHFVSNQQNAMLVANAPQLLQELGGCDDVSALTLHSFDKDRGNLFGWHGCGEHALFEITRTIDRILACVAPLRPAVQVWIWNVCDARNQRGKAPALLRLRSSQRQRAHGAPVERALERDDVLPPAVVA